MRWVVRLFAAAVVLAAGLGQAQQAAPRYALVIGNAAYQTPGWQLDNPVNDANLMATRLRGLGFQVTPLMNATKSQIEAAMNAFTTRVSAGGADAVGVFYYAGHGVEHDGANLLVPVDVTARSMDELRYQAPPMQFLLRDMARAGNKVNVIVLDACRNLPLPSGSRNGPAGGLADLADVPDNVLIAYATRPGLTAPDNPGETNSVFTRTLADALARTPSDTAVNLFAGVQARVFTATGRQQRPEFRSGLLRAPDWRFASAAPAPVDPELERLRRENEALRRASAPTVPAPVSSPQVSPPAPASPTAIARPPQVASSGAAASREMIGWNTLVARVPVYGNTSSNARLQRVGSRVAAVAGLPAQEFVVFGASGRGAYAAPGKLGIDSALVRVLPNDDQLAFVLAHQIAHLTLSHAADRLQGAGTDNAAAIAATGFGLPVGLTLPYSRKHESDADRLAVDLMNRAAYDVREAIKVIEAGAQSGDHPQSTRADDVRAYIRMRGYAVL